MNVRDLEQALGSSFGQFDVSQLRHISSDIMHDTLYTPYKLNDIPFSSLSYTVCLLNFASQLTNLKYILCLYTYHIDQCIQHPLTNDKITEIVDAAWHFMDFHRHLKSTMAGRLKPEIDDLTIYNKNFYKLLFKCAEICAINRNTVGLQIIEQKFALQKIINESGMSQQANSEDDILSSSFSTLTLHQSFKP